jgi:Protein of unknown function (DUF3810)
VRRHRVLGVLSVAAALRLAAQLEPSWVERCYSRALYPRIVASISWATSWTSVAVGEPLAVAFVLGAAAWLARRARVTVSRRWRATASGAFGLLGSLYLAFLLVWGLNYQRLPLAAGAGLHAPEPSREELEGLAEGLVAVCDRLRTRVAQDARGVFRAGETPGEVLDRASLGYECAAARFRWMNGFVPRPKGATASPLLSVLGISGIYLPFTAEPLVDTQMPDSDVPFAAAHEMAHGLGFAREDEANYVGSVACRLHPDAAFRYSGSLVASIYALAALARVDSPAAQRIHEARGAAVRRDLADLAAWSARHEGPVSRASLRVNDAYLRSNGQRAGVASYDRFVDLLVAEERKEGGLVGVSE